MNSSVNSSSTATATAVSFASDATYRPKMYGSNVDAVDDAVVRTNTVDFHALFETARALKAGDGIDLAAMAESINGATHFIACRIVDTVHRCIVAAATQGSDRCDIFRFLGSDLDELSGFPLLTLVKGPRDERIRQQSGPTLLDILADEMKPFQVRHMWNARNNINRIVVFW